jgi:hypothetical protein
MDSRDTLTIKDIEQMVDETPTIEASSRSSAQAMIDLEKVDEISPQVHKKLISLTGST